MSRRAFPRMGQCFSHQAVSEEHKKAAHELRTAIKKEIERYIESEFTLQNGAVIPAHIVSEYWLVYQNSHPKIPSLWHEYKTKGYDRIAGDKFLMSHPKVYRWRGMMFGICMKKDSLMYAEHMKHVEHMHHHDIFLL